MTILTVARVVALVALSLVCTNLQAKLEPTSVEETLNKLHTALVQQGGEGAFRYFGMEIPGGVRRLESKEMILSEVSDLQFMLIASSATNWSIKPWRENSSPGDNRWKVFAVGFEGVVYSDQMNLSVGEVDGEVVILGWDIRQKVEAKSSFFVIPSDSRKSK